MRKKIMETSNTHVITLANSIIGVSILAMPYCFKQCGLLLAIFILLLSSLISRLSCHYLIKSAIMARRKNYEYLAYYLFGGFGKFAIEIGIIGFLIGTCVAFFVVMGDLAPDIVSEIIGQESNNGTLRLVVLIILCFFCVLPLGLLKNIDSFSGVSKATIGFYFCLVVKIVIDALPHIFNGDWINNVDLWRPSGVIQCLPIFSTALSCQTQLFEIYHVVLNPSLEKMNDVIKNAVNICTLVYFLVGVFGCLAYSAKGFAGNILLSFAPSPLTNIVKIGFILSIAFSFPLVIFPCRVSLHSLLYRHGMAIHESTNDYIPEHRFKSLTLIIVLVSLVIAILIPNIEFVLGLVGSSIGIMICTLFPVICFLYVSHKETNERLLAKFMLILALILMVLGTYENLQHLDKIQTPSSVINSVVTDNQNFRVVHVSMKVNNLLDKIGPVVNNTKAENVPKITVSPEVRHEPPQPVEPQEFQSNDAKNKNNDLIISPSLLSVTENDKEPPKVAPDAQDEAVKQEEEKSKSLKDPHLKEHQILIDKIQKQNEVQEEIVKQQKKLIEVIEKQQKDKVKEEKLKAEINAVKEIESIALKAIEKISGDIKENVKIVAKLEKDVQQRLETENVSEKLIMESSSEKLKEAKIDELKLMNSMLSAKIKENNSTNNSQQLSESTPEKNIIKKTSTINNFLPIPLILAKPKIIINNKTINDLNEAPETISDQNNGSNFLKRDIL